MTPEEKFQEIPTNIPDLGKGCRMMDDDDGLTEAELVNLRKSMNRHKGALQRLAGSHVCTLRSAIAENECPSLARLRRWKENLWKPYDELTEEWKEQDRIRAREILAIIEDFHQAASVKK